MSDTRNPRTAEAGKATGLARLISTVCLLAWMLLIFGFSGQNGEESGGLSDKVCHVIVSAAETVTGSDWDEAKELELADAISYPVRKCAHMTEYAILAGLAFAMLYCYGVKGWKRYAFSIIIAFVYASCDELHQLFVSERSGKFTDVLIDTAGATIMMMVIYVIGICRRRKSAVS